MSEEKLNFMGLSGRLIYHLPMARYTSWRVGGPVDRAYFPEDKDDLARFLAQLPQDEPVYFLGLGSNLLIRDKGIRGTVIMMHKNLQHYGVVPENPQQIFAEVGVPSPKIAKLAAKNSLKGAAFLAGIPGTVGGALAMNAGCYGAETWDFVKQVEVMDHTGTIHTRFPHDYDIRYRHIIPKPPIENQSEWFINAVFEFTDGDAEFERQEIKTLLAKRIAAQPLNYPNAGSVFTNPPKDFAARLIQSCELKGYQHGGAQVSEKHANFIINTGSATAEDIETLIYLIQERVFNQTGILLTPEVKILGDAS